MATGKIVTNGGSAIGEAIGDLLEEQVHLTFREIAKQANIRFLTKHGKTTSGKESKKLLLSDDFGNKYNIDGLVISKSGHPLILVESKYIRYKKHNRDKASWICTSHSAIRRHYASIRSSIAVLAGNWSATSLALLKSNGIAYFIIPFKEISRILGRYGVDFVWEENDKDKAMTAWLNFCKLTDKQKSSIGKAMIKIVKPNLVAYVMEVLDDTQTRTVEKSIIEFHTNKGEIFKYSFNTVEEAINFLANFRNDFDETQFISV